MCRFPWQPFSKLIQQLIESVPGFTVGGEQKTETFSWMDVLRSETICWLSVSCQEEEEDGG